MQIQSDPAALLLCNVQQFVLEPAALVHECPQLRIGRREVGRALLHAPLKLLMRAAQLRLRLLALRNVRNRTEPAVDVLKAVPQRRDQHQRLKSRPVLATETQLQSAGKRSACLLYT